MKIEHLEDRVKEYTASIETVVEKKSLWDTQVKSLIRTTLNKVVQQYDIGWAVQELDWMLSNQAINLSFHSFPSSAQAKTDRCPSYNFIPGGALIFTESYSGDVYVFITFPQADLPGDENGTKEIGLFHPQDITEKLILEKVDVFLKEMTEWELPTITSRMGFQR
jgi:hypothetical protein